MRMELAEGKIGDLLKRIEASLTACPDFHANPFVGGSKLTVADLKLGHQLHLIATGNLEFFPDKYVERFPLLNKLQTAVFEHPKVKEYYNPQQFASVIWFPTKEGNLEKFTQVYHDNPFKVVSGHKEANLYSIGHSGNFQGTVVVWNSQKERDVASDREDMKAAINNVKNSGLIDGAPTFRTVEIRAEIKLATGKSVKNNATHVNLLRLKVQEGKLEEFVNTYVNNVIPHLRQFPEHMIKYIGGVDKKENEWVGIAYYTSQESQNIVTSKNENWPKIVSILTPLLADKPAATLFSIKHVWES